jgi:hypothetical protein
MQFDDGSEAMIDPAGNHRFDIYPKYLIAYSPGMSSSDVILIKDEGRQ